MNSPLFSLKLVDILKAILVAAITAAVTPILPLLDSGDFATIFQMSTLILMGKTALVAAIGYLIKNFVTGSSGQVLKP
jgi:hypothetical protein